MEDHGKTKEQLVRELTELRHVTELRQRAEERVRTHPKPTGAMTDTEVCGLVHELQVHQIELEMQNDEFVQAQADLRASSEKCSDLFDFAPIGYFVWGDQGQIVEVNLSGANLLGLDRSTALNKRFGQFVALEDRVAFSEFCKHVLQTDAKQSCEVKLQIKEDDQRVHVLIEAVAVRGCQGKATSCRAAVMDITERKRAEEELHESEEDYRRLTELLPDSIFVVNGDRIAFVNSAGLRLLGASHVDQIVGRPVLDFIHPEDQIAIKNRMQSTFEGKRLAQWMEQRAVRLDGSVVDIEAIAVPFVHHGCLTSQVIVRDITDRKKTEEALQTSERRQKAILDTIPDPAWLKDKEGRFLAVNSAWCRFVGVNAKNAVGKTAFEFFPAEVAQRLSEQDRATLQSRQPLQLEELLTDKDGREIWFETIKNPRFKDDGEIVGTTGLARDITERKRMDQERQIAIEFLRLVNESTGLHDLIQKATNFLQEQSGCEAIGIRLREGDDYPYFEARGFSPEFVRAENSLCVRSENGEPLHDGDGNPMLECMCGNVICSRFDLSKGFFTPKGSFWTNSTTELLANMTEADRETRTRKRCSGEGYESIALICLHSGNKPLGLLQLNDHRKGLFTAGTIAFWERLAGYLAVAVAKSCTENRLREREASLREAQQVACLGSYILDIPQGRWTSSEVLERIFDIQADYARTDEGWGNLVHPDERQMMLDYFRDEVLGKHKPFDREYRIIRYGDRQVRWVHGLGRLEFDAAGCPIRMIGTIQDITERKQAEEALRASEERFRVTFEEAPVGMVICVGDGVIVKANRAMCRMSGYSEEELVGRHVRDLAHPEDRELSGPFVEKLLGGEIHSFSVEKRYIRKDGQPFFAHAMTAAARGPEGKIAFGLGVVQDITDRKRAEQEKLDMERQLLHAQKLESLGILAGGIAHDFNNILAGIMGYADLVKLQLPASEPARKDIDIIKKAVERAAHLTRQMLAYSGKGKFIVEPVSLSQIVKEMRAMMEMSISKKATLNCNLAPNLPMIEADASQIHQIILNLVINASEALGEDSGVITISTDTIHCNATDYAVLGGDDLHEGHYVRLEVSDTGCGMDEQTLAKIFDPFFTTKFTGRGLGLAAVHGILRGHKGGIRVASKPGQGTTFQVFFPAIETPAANPIGESTPAKPWHGTGTVLVVDDEEIVRSLAKNMVEIAGFSVLTAKDGEEAVRMYREHQDEIACVLLDLTMPKMGGEETFRAIRQISPDVRVVLSSGYSEETATGRLAGLGLAGFIQKPYQLDTMIATLRQSVTGGNGE